MSQTRVFFVVDSKEDNEEIFETLEQAQAYKLSATMLDPVSARIYVALVRNAFKEDNYTEEKGQWNYDDFSDTFQGVGELL